ncbi:unnamed protein product [Adineta steineri]|uniref:Uncharacterized protein n=1 Tax=Adineta steineri TaxID=433720 RepID=A0A814BSL9_9BILA|nr:unnamed protein product [Adineta steineri]CAF1323146.1 unnamed protein product [Adineta steineri]CAF1531238.1 unnamed protein product [Adineta steineri]CAF1585579.1 unnamed protein product [Adineta steineri]
MYKSKLRKHIALDCGEQVRQRPSTSHSYIEAPVTYKPIQTFKRASKESTVVPVRKARKITTNTLQHDLSGVSSHNELTSNNTMSSQLDISSNRIIRDEVVRKTSVCLSFYGNFVIIPAIRKTLNNIEQVDNNTKLNYWHEVMAFIDSYDRPYTTEQRKKLVDELVEEVTAYVEREGISAEDWQKLLCTLPDDVNSSFDLRLDKKIFEEIETLAKEKRLPFNLSEPLVPLLKSATEHAGKYIC